MRSEDFLNQMVKTLGIAIDRSPKGRPRKTPCPQKTPKR